MVKVTFHDSFEDMMKTIRDASQSADAKVTDAQKKYRPGDIVISDSGEGFPIFHEILDIEKVVKDNLWKYGEDYEDEGIYTLDLYRQPHMINYCFTRSYSEVCPNGELGDFHRSQGLYRIPRFIFEEMKEEGFRI